MELMITQFKKRRRPKGIFVPRYKFRSVKYSPLPA